MANIAHALMLIPIGIFFFKEEFGTNKLLGILFCIMGLIFINKNKRCNGTLKYRVYPQFDEINNMSTKLYTSLSTVLWIKFLEQQPKC